MCNGIGAGGLSPQIAMLLRSVLNQPQAQPFGLGAPMMDPLAQLQAFMGQMGQTGGAGPMDMGALRRIIRQLDRQIVQSLLSGGFNPQALGGVGANPLAGAGANPLAGIGANPLAQNPIGGLGVPQGIPTGLGTTSLSNCFPPMPFPAAAPNPQVCAPPPPPPCPPKPAPLPVINGDKKGGWLADHGKYTKNKDGSFSLPDGRKVVPIDGKPGSFNVMGPNGQPQGIFNAPGGANKIASPLTLDLNGDGKVSTTGVQDGKKFDINGDGKVDQTAWAGKGDGVLAFGNAASGKELLGNNTDLGDGKKYANGFEALRGLADKYTPGASQDGKLDAQEIAALQQKAGLSIIVDGQRKGLAEAGVREINLGYNEAGQNADANGNEHRQVGAGFVRNDGQKGAINDVWFKYA